MKIEKAELSKKINLLKSVISPSITMEALRGILYQDGYLVASDTSLTVKAKTETWPYGDPFIIPEKAFSFIGSLPEGEIEITTKKNQIVIKMDTIKNSFSTLPADSFAYTTDSIDDGNTNSLDSKELKQAISHVIYAVSESAAPTLQGLNMDSSDGKLNFVAMSEHGIGHDCIDYKSDIVMNVPKAAMEKILKLDFSGEIRISHDKKKAAFVSNEYEIYTRLIEGEFPKYRSILRSGSIYTVVDRRLLLDAVTRAKICRDVSRQGPIILAISDDGIDVSYKDSITDFNETVPIQEKINNKFTMGYNPKLLIDSLKAFECTNVSLEFEGKNPYIIIRAEDSDMSAMIMAVNLGGKK
jgi:DNA polymerase III sliding clamp (beta) subunit (PCNA family)